MIIPLAVLLSRPIIPLMVLMFGQEVKLSTVPYDPRDIFRGDYVALSFAIEEIDINLLSPSLLSRLNLNVNFSLSGTEVHVTLEPDSTGIFNAALVSDTPSVKGVYIRGRIIKLINRERIRIDYGNNLSLFYVKENTGLELEAAARKGQVSALAKVWKGYIILDTIEKILEEQPETTSTPDAEEPKKQLNFCV
jgi:uncharacterized membrane-anchored protein